MTTQELLDHLMNGPDNLRPLLDELAAWVRDMATITERRNA